MQLFVGLHWRWSLKNIKQCNDVRIAMFTCGTQLPRETNLNLTVKFRFCKACYPLCYWIGRPRLDWDAKNCTREMATRHEIAPRKATQAITWLLINRRVWITWKKTKDPLNLANNGDVIPVSPCLVHAVFVDSFSVPMTHKLGARLCWSLFKVRLRNADRCGNSAGLSAAFKVLIFALYSSK